MTGSRVGGLLSGLAASGVTRGRGRRWPEALGAHQPPFPFVSIRSFNDLNETIPVQYALWPVAMDEHGGKPGDLVLFLSRT